MRRHRLLSVDRVFETARLLEELAEEVVFVGGAATGLLITDPAVAKLRPTLDVDVIVEIASRGGYYGFAERLREKGFREPLDGQVICRWVHGDLTLDVMPTGEAVFGFTNPLYAAAIRHSQTHEMDGVAVRAVSSPYFLGTKLEAYFGRGENDFVLSHDIEDMVALLDGRSEIVEDVTGADDLIRDYLGGHFRGLLANREFRDALPGHLDADAASQRRLPIILARMAAIAEVE